MSKEMRIGGRPIGPDHPMYVIAEISGNHNGSLERARGLVKAAAAAGVDAVKLQTYTADTLTIDSDAPPFLVGADTLWAGKTLYGLYQEAYTPWEWHEELFALGRELGVTVFSSPFDQSAIDLLEELEAPAYKIASFEIVDLELVEAAASTGKPIIISTGMSTVEEIDEAAKTAQEGGAKSVGIMRCNSAYPAPAGEMDLRTIPDMQKRWNVPIGLSDHTLGPEAPLAALTLGAVMLEKHFCRSREEPGPDTAFSMEPDEFQDMITSLRRTQKMLGDIRYGPTEHEKSSLVFRRSLFVVEDMAEGETFTRQNVRSIRPGHGMAPKRFEEVLGRRAARDIGRGTPLTEDLVG